MVAPVVVPSQMLPVCAVPYVCAIVIEVVADWTQVPLIAMQPLVKFRPFANVELAVAEVALKMEADRPAPNVEVALLKRVVVAVPFCETERIVVEAFALNCWSELKALAE